MELILESDEWFSIRDEDGALIIHRKDGPYAIYPPHIYCIDATEEDPKILLIFDRENGPWEEYPLEEGHTFVIDDEQDLFILDETEEAIDMFSEEDYYISQDVIYTYQEPDGIEYFGDDEETGIEVTDEFGLFKDLPYEEPNDDFDWTS